MFKRALVMFALVGGFVAADAADADAWIVRRRIAPVRRVVARAVLPPYAVARRVVVARPVYLPVIVHPAPVDYARRVYVGPRVYYGY